MYKPSEMSPKGTVKIGDTLFVDGVPYIQCGVCDLPIRQYDGFKRVVASRDHKHTETKPYKVLLGHWLDTEEYEHDKDMNLIIKMVRKLVLKSVPACFSCWTNFDDRVQYAKANPNVIVTWEKGVKHTTTTDKVVYIDKQKYRRTGR